MTSPPAKLSKDDLQAAYGRTVPDLVRPGIDVLLCGINPSLWSGAVGLHCDRASGPSPSNRLWPTLPAAGWTPRRLHPHETGDILAAGLGITNLVARATARADELSDDELRAGLPLLEQLAALPNPSGLNASWQLPRLAQAYGELRAAARPVRG